MNDLHWDGLDQLRRSHQVRTLAALCAAGREFVIVGGAVRDALLGRTPADLDVIVVGDFDAGLDAVTGHLGRRPADIGDEHQRTHRFVWRGVSIDLACSLGNLDEDLGRRDFTINALALRLAEFGAVSDAMVDRHDGIAHLEAGQLVAIAAANIAADPLRTLRAARYMAQLGFEVEPRTREFVSENAPRLAGVAAERVANEWQAVLAGAYWRSALDFAWRVELGFMSAGARATSAPTAAWEAVEGDVELAGRLAAVLLEVGLDEDVDGLVTALVAGRWPRPLARTAARAAVWSQSSADDGGLAALTLIDAEAARIAGRLARGLGLSALSLEPQAARAVEPRWVTGDDLLAVGCEPGPQLGELLREAAIGQITERWSSAESALGWAQGRARESR
ncbi:MAG: hypothetical protein GKS06_07170 [Acidobacteria bacterium]|nr:hypothetical protein [Acidobacteriota bacterium]